MPLPLYLLNVNYFVNLPFFDIICNNCNNLRGLITNTKIKNMTVKDLTVSIDRLTRFKYPEEKYLRVFKEIILSNLIEPKFKKKDLDIMDYASIKSFAQNIINQSLFEITGINDNSYEINKKLLEYEYKTFYISQETKSLIDNEINYDAFLKLINENSVQNLKWLLVLKNPKNKLKCQKFPVKKVVLVEGITEEILLPEFGKICGFDFDSAGMQIISAGGKNQVVKLFYKYAEQLKIPIFVLLDSDAKENYNQIKLKMRKCDRIHLLKGGEFEDILPVTLIKRTLNDYFLNLNSISDDELLNERMVINLEEIFKKKGFHEFKKSEFAQLVKSHLESIDDISPEIKDVIAEISVVPFSLPQ